MFSAASAVNISFVRMKRSKPLNSVLIKPAGPDCNLACEYCFYLGKAQLFPEMPHHRMPEDVLEALVRQMLEQGSPSISFAWQGGEPTLMGLPFYEKAVEYQKRFGNGRIVGNSLQTNGLLIDADWADFLRENNFLVGLSIDGPQHVHDHYRKNLAGDGSWERVSRAAGLLFEKGAEVNALATVTDYSAGFSDEIYDYLRSLGFAFMQFIPILERAENGEDVAQFSASADAYGHFLCRLFDRWMADFQDGEPTTSIRYFDSLFYRYVGLQPPDCSLMEACGPYVVVEHNGDVYSCDFFVEPRWKLGNVLIDRLTDLLNSPTQQRFGERKAAWPDQCEICKWLPYCYGGCPKDRINGMNHFCESAQMFLEHADSRMQALADEWKRRNLHPPSSPTTHIPKDIGRNDPCPCGSSKKYKHCCMNDPRR